MIGVGGFFSEIDAPGCTVWFGHVDKIRDGLPYVTAYRSERNALKRGLLDPARMVELTADEFAVAARHGFDVTRLADDDEGRSVLVTVFTNPAWVAPATE